MKALRVLIAGGGTGGHLFPGLAVGEEIQKQRPNSELRFVGSKRGIEYRLIPQKKMKLYTLPISGLYRVGLLKQVISLFKLPFAILKCFWIILSYRPHLVIGVGGYASGPMLIAALFLFRRVILQEQNASPGMTNRVLGKYSPLSFVPFKSAQKFFKKAIVVGNPIREEIKQLASQDLKQRGDKFRIFIFGGSQGARILNKTLQETIPLLDGFLDKISIVHQTGKADHKEVESTYKKYNFEFRATPFIEDMKSEYIDAHLIIARAGSSVNEIIAAGRACILVPIKNSSGNHQKKNSLAIQESNAGIMIEEKDFKAKVLSEIIIDFIQTVEKRESFEKNIRSLYPGDSAKIIVDETFKHYNL